MTGSSKLGKKESEKERSRNPERPENMAPEYEKTDTESKDKGLIQRSGTL